MLPGILSMQMCQAYDFEKAGDAAYRNRQYLQALEMYNNSIEITPRNAILLSNRAAVCLKLGLWSRAVCDSEAAFQVLPRYKQSSAVCLPHHRVQPTAIVVGVVAFVVGHCGICVTSPWSAYSYSCSCIDTCACSHCVPLCMQVSTKTDVSYSAVAMWKLPLCVVVPSVSHLDFCKPKSPAP